MSFVLKDILLKLVAFIRNKVCVYIITEILFLFLNGKT